MRALSLIETTIYLALYGLIFASVMHFSLFVTESNQNADFRNELERTAIFLDEHITLSFRNMESVTSDNADYYTNDGRLSLVGSGINIAYYREDNTIKIDRNGTIASLNNPSVIVNKFYLEKVIGPDLNISGVRITIEVESAKRPVIKRTFQTYYSIK